MTKINRLLETKVTRKQFILIILGVVYAISGIKNILNNFEKQVQPTSKKNKKQLTFGNGPYGGGK